MKSLNLVSSGALLLTSVAYATPLGDRPLQLWQISYSAPTRFADGYTVSCSAQTFDGAFSFQDGKLTSLHGHVPVISLSSGLASRDASIRELVFGSQEDPQASIEFQAQPAECQQDGEVWICNVQGSFRIRDEWRPLAGVGYISVYNGRLWLHTQGQIKLSDFGFYAEGPAALKVADIVNITVDLLGPET